MQQQTYTIKNKKTGAFVKFQSDHKNNSQEILKAYTDKHDKITNAHDEEVQKIQNETSSQISGDFHKEHPILSKMLDIANPIVSAVSSSESLGSPSFNQEPISES